MEVCQYNFSLILRCNLTRSRNLRVSYSSARLRHAKDRWNLLSRTYLGHLWHSPCGQMSYRVRYDPGVIRDSKDFKDSAERNCPAMWKSDENSIPLSVATQELAELIMYFWPRRVRHLDLYGEQSSRLIFQKQLAGESNVITQISVRIL